MIERTTSKQRETWFRGYGHLACNVLRVVESLILISVLHRFLIHVLVSWLYPKQEHKQWNNNQSWYNAQATWCNTWHDMQCICVLWKGKDEQGINLANQACRWKDEMILVEIDIKITGNGCTVCKWQEKQEWCKTVINIMMALRMQQETKLLHSNIATKHMAVMYKRCLTKHEHWAMAKSH